jgi:hypothetical protein
VADLAGLREFFRIDVERLADEKWVLKQTGSALRNPEVSHQFPAVPSRQAIGDPFGRLPLRP